MVYDMTMGNSMVTLKRYPHLLELFIENDFDSFGPLTSQRAEWIQYLNLQFGITVKSSFWMTAAITRIDQCIPWSVFVWQLDSLRLWGYLNRSLRGQSRHWKLEVLSHKTPTRGYAWVQRLKVCLNISIIELVVFGNSLVNILVTARPPPPPLFQWWHIGERIYF